MPLAQFAGVEPTVRGQGGSRSNQGVKTRGVLKHYSHSEQKSLSKKSMKHLGLNLGKSGTLHRLTLEVKKLLG